MTVRIPALRSAGGALALAFLAVASAPARALDEVASFGTNPGALRMFEHVPDNASGLMPVVVVLHGCNQDEHFAEDAGYVALADAHGFALVVPVQATRNNSARCFNWYRPDDTRPDVGELASILQMVVSISARHDVAADRVYVSGFSAGGAMAVALMARAPTTFSAGAVFAGVPFGCAADVNQAFACMNPGVTRSQAEWADVVTGSGSLPSSPPTSSPSAWPRAFIWQGLADTTVAPANATALALQWSGVHGASVDPDVVVRDDGRSIERWTLAGATRVELVRAQGVGHVHPADLVAGCGRTAAFVEDTGQCGAQDAVAFFGLAAPSEEAPPAPTPPRADADGTDSAGDGAAAESSGCAASADGAPAGMWALWAAALLLGRGLRSARPRHGAA